MAFTPTHPPTQPGLYFFLVDILGQFCLKLYHFRSQFSQPLQLYSDFFPTFWNNQFLIVLYKIDTQKESIGGQWCFMSKPNFFMRSKLLESIKTIFSNWFMKTFYNCVINWRSVNKTDFRWPNTVLCKMTNHTLKMTDLLMKLNLNSLWHLNFCAVFIKPWERAKRAGLGRLSKRTTMFKSNFWTVKKQFKV